jgi:hypothetical protein
MLMEWPTSLMFTCIFNHCIIGCGSRLNGNGKQTYLDVGLPVTSSMFTTQNGLHGHPGV